MSKFDLNKMKDSLPKVEKFAHKYTVEVLTVVAIVVAAFSAGGHFFVGTLGWSMLLLVIGAVVGVFFPVQMDKWIKKVYSFSGTGMSAIVAEVIKIAIALFLPFLYFGFLGLLTGTAYQYYIHHPHTGNKNDKAA